MLPASNRGAGMNMGFPDVVNTVVGPATVPIPYPNLAQNATATGFATTVYVGMVNALNVGSTMPMTNGDEAGTAGPNMGKGSYTTGNPIVYVETLPAIQLCAPATGNNSVCGLDAALVPSVSVVSFTQRATSTDLVEDYLALAASPVRFSEHDGVLTCRVALVTRDAARLFRNEIAVRGSTGCLVLDLRGCPGGDLEGAVDLAGCFLEPGSTVASFVDGDGDEELLATRGAPVELSGELRVLVDARTASAAEVLARALERAGGDRVRVEGGPTFGKRSVAGVRGESLVCLGAVRIDEP